MTTYAFNVVAPRPVLDALRGPSGEVHEQPESETELTFSAPMLAESPADRLNSPITGDDMSQGLELITVAAGSATALLTFADRLATTLRKHKDAKARVSDALSGEDRGEIDGTVDEAKIVELLSE